jgi:hypothetical protein
VTDAGLRGVAALGLVVGAVLGMAGTFVSSAPLRGLAWGLDGIALVLAGALLTVHHVRRGNDAVAAGFLVFVVGEGLVLTSATLDVAASAPFFAAGVGLWAASLALVSSANTMPPIIRGIGFMASLLFTIVAVQMFLGRPLTPLSEPLPFFAYPFFALTLFGWAWVHSRPPV